MNIHVLYIHPFYQANRLWQATRQYCHPACSLGPLQQHIPRGQIHWWFIVLLRTSACPILTRSACFVAIYCDLQSMAPSFLSVRTMPCVTTSFAIMLGVQYLGWIYFHHTYRPDCCGHMKLLVKVCIWGCVGEGVSKDYIVPSSDEWAFSKDELELSPISTILVFGYLIR